ncbi:MAG: hypothetical protein V3R64_04630 [Sphingomonadales bacterium]
MAIFLELFNWAILIALIIFSAWSFYLQYKADRVTTTKDLLLAYVTGGALAVVTMVFGVTGDIVTTSNSIKADTVSIRSTLEGEGPIATPPDAQITELLRVNHEQTHDLEKVLEAMANLQKNSEQTNQLVERILGASGTRVGLTAKFSGSQLFIPLNLFCTIPVGDETSNCVVMPNER